MFLWRNKENIFLIPLLSGAMLLDVFLASRDYGGNGNYLTVAILSCGQWKLDWPL